MRLFQRVRSPEADSTAGDNLEDTGEEVRDYAFGARGGWVRRSPKVASGTKERLKADDTQPSAAMTAISAIFPRPSGDQPNSLDIGAAAGITGFLGACLVDSASGLMLASAGGDRSHLETVAAFNTQVVRACYQSAKVMDRDDRVEEVVITLGKQICLMRPIEQLKDVFLYVELDKKRANLAIARMQVAKIEGALVA